MKIRFEMKTEFSEKDPHIVIQAARLTDHKGSHGVFDEHFQRPIRWSFLFERMIIRSW